MLNLHMSKEQPKTSDWFRRKADTAIVLRHVDASKLIFNNWKKGAEKKELRNMTVYSNEVYSTMVAF